MSLIDVDTVATDADLVRRCARVTTAMPLETDRDSIRQLAMDDVEQYLRQRRPSISPGDLANHAELRDAVVYRTLYMVFQTCVSQEGDVHWVLMREYEKQFRGEIDRTYSVGSLGEQSMPQTLRVYRG